MSLESSQRGLYVVVSRKRERSPRSRREESLLLAPTTPPATERTTRMFDDDAEDDWGVSPAQAWGHNYVSEIQEPHSNSRTRPRWAAQAGDALLVAYQDLQDATPNFPEESPSHLPFAMSTFDVESYNVGTQSRTQSGLLALSREDMEDIGSAAAGAVTASPVTPRPADYKPVVVQPGPTIEDLQFTHPEDEEFRDLP